MTKRGYRTLKWTCLIGAIAALLFGGMFAYAAVMRWWGERPLYGRLSYGSALEQPLQFDVAPFRILWTPDNGGMVSVVHEALPDKALWESVPAVGFVGAAHGEERVVERRGMFSFRDRLRRRYPHQHIERIASENGEVHIAGHLGQRADDQCVAYTLSFSAKTPERLVFELHVDDGNANRAYLTHASSVEEDFFGFGAQFTHVNLKGRRVPIFVMEQGIGRGRQPLTFFMSLIAGAGGTWHTTYAAAPHYLTSAMRSFFLHTHEYAVFDLRAPERVQVMLFSGTMRGSILAGDSPESLIKTYTEAAGRMRPLPDWILEGAVVGMQGGTEKVRRVWQALREHDTPVSAFWLQDWVGQRRTIAGKQLWWNWELDRDHYPDWEALVNELASDGIRVMSYVNPFLADPSGREYYRRNLFQEACERGFVVQTATAGPYLIKNTDFSAAMLDLNNPEAREWFKTVMHEQVIKAGVSGWMADFGEALPYDARLHGDTDAEAYDNRYPEEWARLNREVIEETGRGDDFVFFMRSGYRESPRYATLFWLGDQMVTWDRHDGMKSAVSGLLSSGMSGYAFNHSDIGGYTAIGLPMVGFRRDRELLMRWMEMNAFSVVFRTHEGVAPQANHQFYSDAETLAHFSRCARIYAAWAAYRKELVQEAATTGLPVVRHPFIHYPADDNVRNIAFEQFLVGIVFMVAPVLEPGVAEVSCYLPAGRWTHLWSGEEYALETAGRKVTVAAPLGEPAVFYVTGAAPAHAFLLELERLQLL